MSLTWLLLFNCFAMPDGHIAVSNIAQQVDKNYGSEQACLKDARKGLKKYGESGCYYVCVKGYRNE